MDVPLTKLDFPLTFSATAPNGLWLVVWLVAALGTACGDASTESDDSTDPTTTPPTTTEDPGAVADVIGVSATGSDGAWTFAVTIRSDETGCDLYADWWELVTPEGDLVHRRILNHSHPDDQPFTRSSEEPVDVVSTLELYARAHLAPGGYVGSVYGGTIDGGFSETPVTDGFAADLESVAPQPNGCLF